MAVATEAIAVRRLSKTDATRDGAVTALDRTTFGIAEGELRDRQGQDLPKDLLTKAKAYK